MGPNQFGPPGQMVPKIFYLPRGEGFCDLGIGGPDWLGAICPWGPNFWGPFVQGDQIWWEPFVQGDQIGWGPFVHEDQIFGDHLSMGTGIGGPEVRGSSGVGTKWVAAVRTDIFKMDPLACLTLDKKYQWKSNLGWLFAILTLNSVFAWLMQKLSFLVKNLYFWPTIS